MPAWSPIDPTQAHERIGIAGIYMDQANEDINNIVAIIASGCLWCQSRII